HDALSSASVFVDYSADSDGGTISSATLSLVNMETNTTVLSRTLPSNQRFGRVEFNCSCFLYAGTFRFLLRVTRTTAVLRANGTGDRRTEGTARWWSSELQVHWPTFHIAVERTGNHSESFQVGISTNEHFQACSYIVDSALFLEVSYMEYNQIGRKSIAKVRARTRHPIKALQSQSVELPCVFPFSEKDFIQVALRSPHAAQEVKSSGALYLSRIFSYQLLVDNSNSYRSGCEGTMTVRLMTPPCVHISGKVLLYRDAGSGQGATASSGVGAGGRASLGFGPEEPTSPPLAFNWLANGENETEFNCSLFYPGRNEYCFRFVFNFSRSSSPAHTCLAVHRSTELWGPWQPWSLCSVSCGEGVRERVRECLLPGLGGMQCTGIVKEQSLCSLEDCGVRPAPSPSAPVGITPLGVNMVVVLGIALCLAVILSTVVVTVWRKFCQTPQCSSAHRGSMHSPAGRKLSDEASICGNSLQRPSVSDGPGTLRATGASAAQGSAPVLQNLPASHALVIPVSPDPERLSPTCQKMLPTVFGYRLAQQQLKEMKKKGLKEATQLYHVSSSPVGSRTLPDGSCWSRERWERQLLRAHAIPEDGVSEWTKFRPYVDHQGKSWPETPSHSRLKNTGTNTSSLSTYLKHTSQDLSEEKQRSSEAGIGQGISGIGGPAPGPPSLSTDAAERAEQNWNRRGPSPIHRNMLARKLKAAQAGSVSKGRQRSSTFSVSSAQQRTGRCRSLPMSGDGSHYRLSEAEQRMLDLDLSSAVVGE
ncbi:unnamed protein product, partial [Tetraodon nigroviridis]